MNTKFDAKQENMHDLFRHADTSFSIPLYQRKYDWKAKKEVKELLDDLFTFFKNRKSADETYYLGNIITKIAENKMGDIDRVDIVDGQQRITTILLIYKSLLDLSSDNSINLSYEDQQSFKKIYNKIFYVSNEDNDRQLKIQNKSFDKYIRRIFGNEVTTFNGLKDTNYYLNKIFIDEYLKKEIDDNEKFNKLVMNLNSIKFVNISLGSEDSEISVFENINSKGKDLSVHDLVKNYFYLMSEKKHTSEDIKDDLVETFDTEIFNTITKLVGSKTNDAKISLQMKKFYQSFIAYKKGIQVPSDTNQLYSAIKDIFPLDTEKSIINILDEFNFAKSLYEYIASFRIQEASTFEICMSYIINNRLDVTMPLLISFAAKDGITNKPFEIDNNFKELIIFMEKYFIRRSVIGSGNKNANKFLAGLSKNVINQYGDLSATNIKTYLKIDAAKTQDGHESMENFLPELKNSNLYSGKKSVLAKYILLRINNEISYEENITSYDGWTIEHLMNKSFSQAKPYISHIENYEEQHNLNKHKIGNLTLAKSDLNNELGSKPFETKKHILNQKSNLRLNKDLEKYDVWNFDTIKERGEELAKVAQIIWQD